MKLKHDDELLQATMISPAACATIRRAADAANIESQTSEQCAKDVAATPAKCTTGEVEELKANKKAVGPVSILPSPSSSVPPSLYLASPSIHFSPSLPLSLSPCPIFSP
jgi:hypothetical protein